MKFTSAEAFPCERHALGPVKEGETESEEMQRFQCREEKICREWKNKRTKRSRSRSIMTGKKTVRRVVNECRSHGRRRRSRSEKISAGIRSVRANEWCLVVSLFNLIAVVVFVFHYTRCRRSSSVKKYTHRVYRYTCYTLSVCHRIHATPRQRTLWFTQIPCVPCVVYQKHTLTCRV